MTFKIYVLLEFDRDFDMMWRFIMEFNVLKEIVRSYNTVQSKDPADNDTWLFGYKYIQEFDRDFDLIEVMWQFTLERAEGNCVAV